MHRTTGSDEGLNPRITCAWTYTGTDGECGARPEMSDPYTGVEAATKIPTISLDNPGGLR